MPDLADLAQEFTEGEDDARAKRCAHIVKNIPPPKPGECKTCGNEMPRLIQGICCKCFDANAKLRYSDPWNK